MYLASCICPLTISLWAQSVPEVATRQYIYSLLVHSVYHSFSCWNGFPFGLARSHSVQEQGKLESNKTGNRIMNE